MLIFYGDNLYHGDDHGDDHGNDHCDDHGDDNGDDQGGDYGDDHGDHPTRSGWSSLPLASRGRGSQPC